MGFLDSFNQILNVWFRLRQVYFFWIEWSFKFLWLESFDTRRESKSWEIAMKDLLEREPFAILQYDTLNILFGLIVINLLWALPKIVVSMLSTNLHHIPSRLIIVDLLLSHKPLRSVWLLDNFLDIFECLVKINNIFIDFLRLLVLGGQELCGFEVEQFDAVPDIKVAQIHHVFLQLLDLLIFRSILVNFLFFDHFHELP